MEGWLLALASMLFRILLIYICILSIRLVAALLLKYAVDHKGYKSSPYAPGYVAGVLVKLCIAVLVVFCCVQPWSALIVLPFLCLCLWKAPELTRLFAQWVKVSNSIKTL